MNKANRVVLGENSPWHRGMTVKDLLDMFGKRQPIVGVFVNGIYNPRSRFSEITIPKGAVVEFIPWQDGMTLRDLQKCHPEGTYICAATVDGQLVSEDGFDKTLVPADADVYLLTYVGGG